MKDKDPESPVKRISCYNILYTQKKDPSPPSRGVGHDFPDWETFKLQDEILEFAHNIRVDELY